MQTQKTRLVTLYQLVDGCTAVAPFITGLLLSFIEIEEAERDLNELKITSVKKLAKSAKKSPQTVDIGALSD